MLYLSLEYCPSVDEWQKKKDTFIRKTTWDRLAYGEKAGLFAKKDIDLYKGTPGFLLVHSTEYDSEEIYQADVEKLRFLDGIWRGKNSDGDSWYGTIIFSKKSGECGMAGMLVKKASGKIEYDYETSLCVFNTSSLEWKLGER